MTVDALPLRGFAARGDVRLAGLRHLPIRTLAVLADVAAFFVPLALLGLSPTAAALAAAVGYVATRRPGRRRARLVPSAAKDAPWLLARVAVVTVVALLLPVTEPYRQDLVAAAPVVLAGLLVGRTVANRLLAALRRRGIGLEPAIVVGGGPTGIAVANALSGRREFGLHPVGFVEVGRVDHDLPTLGRPSDLVGILLGQGIRRVVVAFSGSREADLVNVLRDCSQLRFQHHVHVLPRFFELGVTDDRGADDLWGFPLVPLRPSGPTPLDRRLKRLLDVSVAGLMLLLTAPVFALVALGVRLSGPGPILFRQKRVGQYGQVFEMIKFRTMAENDDSETQWSVDDDDRVTRVGRFLRPTHLDELPQLLNVLRGDMALVGPRPERPIFVEQFAIEHRGYENRHRVPVGLTGWAQVNGLWGDTSIADRARFDNAYIENWSLRRELGILLRTVPTVFGGRRDDR